VVVRRPGRPRGRRQHLARRPAGAVSAGNAKRQDAIHRARIARDHLTSSSSMRSRVRLVSLMSTTCRVRQSNQNVQRVAYTHLHLLAASALDHPPQTPTSTSCGAMSQSSPHRNFVMTSFSISEMSNFLHVRVWFNPYASDKRCADFSLKMH